MAINREFLDELEKKTLINTPEGQVIVKKIEKHPAYIGLVERLKKIIGRTTAKQQRYLIDGRMYSVVLALVRQKVEKTDCGQAIVEANPDRRIYALLKPTPAEDLHRMKVVLDCVSKIASPQEYEHFWLSLQGYRQAIPIAKKYDEGKMPYETARDLLDEIFSPEQD